MVSCRDEVQGIDDRCHGDNGPEICMRTDNQAKLKRYAKFIVTILVLGSVLCIGLSTLPKTQERQAPDQDAPPQRPGQQAAKDDALRAELAALNACFVVLHDVNLPFEATDRALRQE